MARERTKETIAVLVSLMETCIKPANAKANKKIKAERLLHVDKMEFPSPQANALVRDDYV